MSTTDLRTIPNGAAHELAPIADPVPAIEILDVYAGGVSDETPRLEWVATISAGEKVITSDGKEFPRASKDGRIFLHDPDGRAPGLAAALEKGEGKRLTIAFPYDDPNEFIRQHFAWRTASSIKAWGDQHALHVIEGEGKAARPVVHESGSDGYAAALRQCKVEVDVLFLLADYDDQGQPFVEFPDGWGSLYRLRFTSRNSLRSIANTLTQVGKFTRGRVRGIPFELSISYRDVADGTGSKRHVPVWVLAMKPPRTLRLSSRNFAEVTQAALAEGSRLMLPPAREQTFETAVLEPLTIDLDEPSEDEAALIGRGGRCDRDHWRKRWHALVAGTELDSDEARAAFLADYTSGQTRSLGEFLLTATEGDASSLIGEALSELLRGTKPDADPLRIVRLQREYLDSLKEEPLERDGFLWLALQLPGLTIKADVSAALEVNNVMVWEARGFGTWEDALRRLHVWAENTAVEVIDSGEGEVRAAEALDALRDEMDAPGLSDEERDALEFADAVEEDQPFEDDGVDDDPMGNPPADVPEPDPLVQDAEDTIRWLMAATDKGVDQEGLEPVTDAQLRKLGKALGAVGLDTPQDRQQFVRIVFDVAADKLVACQSDALLAWAQTPRARSQVQTVLAVLGGREGLVEL